MNHEDELSQKNKATALPLEGIKVLELGQLIAGPFAGKTLADFGASVTKIEPPARNGLHGGDPLRRWRMLRGDSSLWWELQSRNKRSVAVDLRDPEGQDIVRQLSKDADVLIENFRPGVMEDWGLGPELLLEQNPSLIVLRVSGYGQTGPYRDKPGFGAVAEAMGGLRHLTGEMGQVPVRAGVSIGDTLASLHGVIGILIALHHRSATRSPQYPCGRGQIVDVALYEAVFNCMESLVPEYDALGHVRGPAGSALPGIAPSNAYVCKNQEHVIVAGNGDGIFKRLMTCIGRPDLAADPALADNAGRVAQVAMLDAVIGRWTMRRTVAEVLAALDAAQVPAGRIYTAADICNDPQYIARGMIERIRLDDGTTLAMPGIVPKLSLTPGTIRRNAPILGQDTDEVLDDMGLSAEHVRALKEKSVIAGAKR